MAAVDDQPLRADLGGGVHVLLEQLAARAALTRDAETGLFAQDGILIGTDAKGAANELWTTLHERRLCLATETGVPPERIDLTITAAPPFSSNDLSHTFF
ncbi:hypothetical protein, partial [uncultured Nocardioides sp.]|uniref:hypothetical protein n=1 Tax=uncultured Nocardioides sp. TaxID=198441 RepID=UPI00262E192D